MNKKCIRCKVEKEIDDFYIHKGMKDGHLNKCKECCKKESDLNFKNKMSDSSLLEKERLRGRNKNRIGSKQYTDAKNKWQTLYPEKRQAHIKSQRLKKPFKDAHGHHWSYNDYDAKDVIWLNKKDHYKAHRFIIYDQERKMYRTYDMNELLDTKEKHEKFILKCIKTKPD